VTHRAPTRRRDAVLVLTQEERLLDLLSQTEGYAYALAHSYDVARQPGRAYAFLAIGERLRETVADVSSLVRQVEPHGADPALGLVSRAFGLRRLLRGTGWEGPNAALGGEQGLGVAAGSEIGTNKVLALLTPADHLA
jgi:hypothetical protein